MVCYHCAHIVHTLFTDCCLQSRLLVLAARHLNWLQQSEQNDGCIYKSSIKLTRCEWPFPGVHHLQLRSHLPQVCAGVEDNVYLRQQMLDICLHENVGAAAKPACQPYGWVTEQLLGHLHYL